MSAAPERPPDRPRDRAGIAAAVVAAVDRARPGCVLVSGPPGSGTERVLDLAARRGAEQGLACHRWPDGHPPFGWAPPSEAALLLVDHAQCLTAAAIVAVGPATVTVATVCEGHHVADPAALANLAAHPSTQRLRLAPLTDREIATLVPAPLVTTVAELTGGNAELVELVGSVARTLQEEPRPDGLAALLTGHYADIAERWGLRLESLGPLCRPLAEAVAVLGASTPLWVAAEAEGLDVRAAVDAADTLVEAGILRRADPLEPALALVQSALAAATGARHDQARRRAARALGRTPGGLDAAADHLVVTPPSGEPWAADLLRRCARERRARGDQAGAVVALERALEEPLDAAQRAATLLELGDAHAGADTEGAVAAYRRALREVDADDRPGVHLRLGRALYGAGDYRGAGLELERGLAGLAEDDVELRTELIAAYVAAARFDRDLEDAAGRYLAPLVARDGPGRSAAERVLLAEVALEHGIRGAPRDRVLSLAERAWADGILLDGADEYGIALSQVAAAFTWSDAPATSARVLTATVTRAEGEGSALLAATARYLRAWPRYYLGELAAAETDARTALNDEGWHMYEASARAILGHALIDLGSPAAAAEAIVLDDVARWEHTVPFAMLLETRSRLHIGAGRLPEAAGDLEEVGRLLESIGNRSPFCPWRSRLGTVVTALGDPERGLALIETELAQAREIGLPRATGVALRARALLTTPEAGLLDLEAACGHLELAGTPVELARALISTGQLLREADRPVEARGALRRTLAIIDRTGAEGLRAEAERELRLAGGRPSRRIDPHGDRLTTSERRVAELAAHERTNREIAEQLVISPHTVRFHLSGVYRKLGVTARGQLRDALAADESSDAGT